jgi:hypothetical protein
MKLLLSLLSIPLMAQVSPVASSESKDVVPAFDSSGAITLPAASLKLDILYPNGKKERCELTVVYDPKTGHYLWHHLPLGNRDDTAVYISGIKTHRIVEYADSSALVDVGFASGPFIKAWQGHAGSLDAAVSASLNEIQHGLATFEGGYHVDYKLVPVGGPVVGFDSKVPPGFKPIPPDFWCAPLVAWCGNDRNTIASIGKQGSNWRLVLRNRWDEEVILDQNFNLVSAQQLTQPKQSSPARGALYKEAPK